MIPQGREDYMEEDEKDKASVMDHEAEQEQETPVSQAGQEMPAEEMMDYIDSIRDLLHTGREKGFVTYEDIEKRLPKEILSAEILDNIYLNIMELGIDVVDEPKVKDDIEEDVLPLVTSSDDSAPLEELPLSDPVRMYLREIGKISLLTADE